MLGLYMSFTRFRPGAGFAGIFTSDFVGLQWFRQFFQSPYAWRLIRNTFLLSFYSLIFGFPVPIIFAVCITQVPGALRTYAVAWRSSGEPMH